MSGFIFIIVSILLFVLILSVLVIVHELGHFVVAKYFGVRVDEFGLGYPPKAKKLFTWRGTVFTLNWLPFGGFVKIFGEDGADLEKLPLDEQKQSFVSKPKYVQAAVLIAGVVMNFLAGWVLVSSLYMAGTMIIFDDTLPARYLAETTELVIETVAPGTPADIAHLTSGDVVASVTNTINDSKLESLTPRGLTEFVRGSEGVPLRFEITRNSGTEIVVITPALDSSGSVYRIGVTPALSGYVKLPFFTAIGQGFNSSIYLVKETAGGLLDLVTRKASFDTVAGPVGMVGMVGTAAHMGIEYVVLFAALISLSLAVINLVPFPALDGGRLLFVGIEAITRRKLPTTVTAVLNTVGFFLLIFLMLFVTYHDIVRLVVK